MVIASPAAPVATSVSFSASSLRAKVRSALERYAKAPDDAECRQEATRLRREAAAVIALLPSANRAGVEVEAAREILRVFAASGLNDFTVEAQDLAAARELRRSGWTGLWAAMLLVPAWQWPEAPALADAPSWMWGDYTRYLFANPQRFTAVGQANAFAAHYLKRLEQLARVAAANRGSSAVQVALKTYLEFGNAQPLSLAQGSLRQHLSLRGQILAAARTEPTTEAPVAMPCENRRLRIGVVCRAIDDEIESRAAVATFDHLDVERFEVVVFLNAETNSELETYVRNRVETVVVLPPTLAAKKATVRAASLDVVLFSGELTGACDEFVSLALHRLAPLQVAHHGSGTTTGLPEMDLVLSSPRNVGERGSAEYNERVALLPETAHVWHFSGEAASGSGNLNRAAAGLPTEALVFVTAVSPASLSPETQSAWAEVLVAIPNSRLVLHFPGAAAETVAGFCGEFDRILRRADVDDQRLHVFAGEAIRGDEIENILGLGDIYLDAFPASDAGGVARALRRGLPVVAWEGREARARAGASLLRGIGLSECVAEDAVNYVERCLRLAGDTAYRTTVRERIKAVVDRAPLFLDTHAASDAFGELVSRAFEEIVADGTEAFRKKNGPFCPWQDEDVTGAIVAADSLREVGMIAEAKRQAGLALAAAPASPDVRQALARIAAAERNFARAAEYMIAALHAVDAPAASWRELAGYFEQAGNRQSAITALEIALKVDGQDAESWFMLGDFALRSRHAEILRDVAGILQTLASADQRTQSILSALKTFEAEAVAN